VVKFLRFKKVWPSLAIAVLIVGIFPPPWASAALNSCSSNSSPSQISISATTDIQFSLQNTDIAPVIWVQVVKPSGYLTLSGVNADGWAGSTDGTVATLAGGNIEPGATLYFTITVVTSDNQTSGDRWTIRASDDASGENAVDCYGSHSLDTVAAAVVPPNISNVHLSNLTTSSVIVAWDTDVPSSSVVEYGQTTDYGTSGFTNDGLQTNHSVTLKNLSPNTAYHYRVASTDANNNAASSGDNTFLTPLPVSANTESNSTSFISTPIPIKAIPTEKIPPTIGFATIFKNPYKQAPLIKGTAKDNEALAGIEYSIDGGGNWLPVDSQPGIGGKEVEFSFTPTSLDDGNYSIATRAIDTSGNIGLSIKQELIIDRLPPIVGGNLVSIGPQILEPTQDGTLGSIVGVDQKITLSAVGGPTNISLKAVPKDLRLKAKNFTLTRSPDNGLWSGVLAFEDSGTYTITANSLDGAGNKTSRELNAIQVLPAGNISNSKTKKPVMATVSVYYLQQDSNNWALWDGSPYGQTNPQKTGRDGQFNLFLPAGKYYLKTSVKGYHGLRSNIFGLKQSTPISTSLSLKPRKLKLGSLNTSWLDLSSQKINLSGSRTKNKGSNLVGKSLPEFKLDGANGTKVNSVDLLGKPTVLTFMSTWSPTTTEQISALAKLQANKDINIAAIAEQENSAKARTYSEIANYQLNWLADPDSTLSRPFNIQSLPVHYFVDRKGIIKKVVSGVLTKTEITDGLSGL
jgi:peroxiredoxin